MPDNTGGYNVIVAMRRTCFLDKDRPCDKTCMAYNEYDGRCMILAAFNAYYKRQETDILTAEVKRNGD